MPLPAALFCFTALGHFAKPDEMLEMLPPWAPSRKLVVVLSGMLEVAFAIGILIPVTSRLTAITVMIFLFLAAPLNIYAAYRRVDFGGHAAGPTYLLTVYRSNYFQSHGFGGSLYETLDLTSILGVGYPK